MDHLLSLSQAARMVGIRRRTLQQYIQEGKLMTFEGALRMSELLKVFPNADADRSGMLEKMQRIQDGALAKLTSEGSQEIGKERLVGENHRLRLELQTAREELNRYCALTDELKDRLYLMQEQCDQKQQAILNAFITWFVRKTQDMR